VCSIFDGKDTKKMGDKSQKMGKLMFKGEWKMSDVGMADGFLFNCENI